MGTELRSDELVLTAEQQCDCALAASGTVPLAQLDGVSMLRVFSYNYKKIAKESPANEGMSEIPAAFGL